MASQTTSGPEYRLCGRSLRTAMPSGGLMPKREVRLDSQLATEAKSIDGDWNRQPKLA